MAGLRDTIKGIEAHLRDTGPLTGLQLTKFVLEAFQDIDQRLTAIEQGISPSISTQGSKPSAGTAPTELK